MESVDSAAEIFHRGIAVRTAYIVHMLTCFLEHTQPKQQIHVNCLTKEDFVARRSFGLNESKFN